MISQTALQEPGCRDCISLAQPVKKPINAQRTYQHNVTGTQLNRASMTHAQMTHWRETTPFPLPLYVCFVSQALT